MDTRLVTTGILGLNHILGGSLPANRLEAKNPLRAEIAGLVA